MLTATEGPKLKDTEGSTVIHQACMHCSLYTFFKILHLLYASSEKHLRALARWTTQCWPTETEQKDACCFSLTTLVTEHSALAHKHMRTDAASPEHATNTTPVQTHFFLFLSNTNTMMQLHHNMLLILVIVILSQFKPIFFFFFLTLTQWCNFTTTCY